MRLLLSPDAAIPAAPAKPASPPASTPAPQPPASTPTDAGGDPFAALDAKAKVPDKPKPAAPSEPPKPTDAKPAEKVVVRDKTPKEMRQEFDRLNGELTKERARIKEFEGQRADHEKRGEEVKGLVAAKTAAENQVKQLQAEIRGLKQEASEEFKNQYDKPFRKAADYARRLIEGLTITDPETEITRAATFDDFRSLYGMPVNKASLQAKQLFGDAASLVMQQITELHKLEYDRDEALKEERANYEKRSKEDEGKRVAMREQFDSLKAKVRQELTERVADYRDDPEDKELTVLRNEGYALYDAEPRTSTEVILKAEHLRHRAAAFAPMKLTIGRLQAKISDLEAQLDALKPKLPGDTKRGGAPEAGKPQKSWEDEAAESIRNAR